MGPGKKYFTIRGVYKENIFRAVSISYKTWCTSQPSSVPDL